MAVSSDDTVNCNNPFVFIVETNNDAIEYPGKLIPERFSIHSAYPNPFNPTLNITVGLPEPSYLIISVFNITGQRVATLAKNQFTEGYHNLTFDGSKLSSGIYIIRATVPGKMNQVRKVVLMK